MIQSSKCAKFDRQYLALISYESTLFAKRLATKHVLTKLEGFALAASWFSFILVWEVAGGRRRHVQGGPTLITTGESGNVLALGSCLLPGPPPLPTAHQRARLSCTNVLVTDLDRQRK